MAALVTVEADDILNISSGYGQTTLTSASTTGAITTLAVAGTGMPASAGSTDILLVTDGTNFQVFVCSASFLAAATSYTITSATPLHNFPIGSMVYDLSLAGAYKPPYGPIKVALNTAVGSASAAGTEVTGGSYARQALYFSVSSAEANTSNVTLTYTSMPSCTVTSIDEFDSAGTPVRRWWGTLSATKVVNVGDTFTIASGSYSKTLS